MSNNNSNKTKVLVVGGGFAGVKAALELAKSDSIDVTLLSDQDHFRYYPKLYHAATGGSRDGSHISLKNILLETHDKFVRGTAVKLDRKNKTIETKEGQKLSYDKLILGLGNITNYFGIEGLAEHSYGIKTIEEAERFKKHLHEQFIKNGCPDLNYVVVGAGPTGIELAAALPGYLKQIMKKHGIKDCPVNVSIVEALPKLLPRSPEKVSDMIARRLKKLGIKLYLGTAVKGQSADKLKLGEEELVSQTVVWTAGVTNNPFFKDNEFKLSERGKVEVDEYLQAEQDIYVVGDNANTQFSGMAQTALIDGHFVAEHIIGQLEGKEAKKYVPKAPISVIPVGPMWAIVQWGKVYIGGSIGWLLRLAADLIAYHDLQSWPKAGKQWMKSLNEDGMNCPDCCEDDKLKKSAKATA